jgi:hypothetical protein
MAEKFQISYADYLKILDPSGTGLDLVLYVCNCIENYVSSFLCVTFKDWNARFTTFRLVNYF